MQILFTHIKCAEVQSKSIRSVLIPVAARAKAWACGRSFAGIVGSNPIAEALMSVSCDSCVLSGRGLCDGLIIRPEESYRVWFV